MKRYTVSTIAVLSLLSGFASEAFAVQQTICFSKKQISEYNGIPIYQATLGDSVSLYGGKCHEKTLPQMNKAGWRLIQVVGGLDSAFGMVFQKGK